MKQIVLVTTDGCEACNIMRKNCVEAIKETSKVIDFKERNIAECSKWFIKKNNITDFPTILLIENDIVKFKYTGTRPKIVILRWTDVWFT